MTENKRFNLRLGRFYDGDCVMGNLLNDKQVLQLLNRLAEENEQLKQENQELRHFKLSIKAFAECNDNINRRTLNDLIWVIDYD